MKFETSKGATSFNLAKGETSWNLMVWSSVLLRRLLRGPEGASFFLPADLIMLLCFLTRRLLLNDSMLDCKTTYEGFNLNVWSAVRPFF